MDERTDGRTDQYLIINRRRHHPHPHAYVMRVVLVVLYKDFVGKRVSMLGELGIIRGEPELTRRGVANGVPRKWVP